MVELFQATSAFTEVLDHEVMDLEGKSKVLVVHSDTFDAPRDAAGASSSDLRYRFWLSVWIFREDDPDQTEDDMDDLAVVVIDTILVNRKLVGFWDQIMFVGVSQPTYVEVENRQYRHERVLVETKHLLEP